MTAGFATYLFVGVLSALAVVLIVALVRRSFPPRLKVTGVGLAICAIYLFALVDALSAPWTLWRVEATQDSSDVARRRVARYVVESECIKSQWRLLDDEMRMKTEASRIVDRMFEKTPQLAFRRVLLREGRTLFEFRASLLGRVLSEKRLTAAEKEFLQMPEIVATVSAYCAPTARDDLWPFYTPDYKVAADDLLSLGERTLATKAQPMLQR